MGKSRAGWTTNIHMIAADARTAVTFSLSAGHAGDAAEGRSLLKTRENHGWKVHPSLWIRPNEARAWPMPS